MIYNNYVNGLKRLRISVYIGIPLKVAEWLDINIDGYYDLYKESYLDRRIKTESWGFGTFVNIALPSNFRIEQHLYYNSAIKTLYSKQHVRPMYNISISRNFPKQRIKVSLSFSDIFNGEGSKRMDSFQENFYQVSKGMSRNFGVSFKVGYNLRWGKKSNVRRASAGNSSEANRVASE